MTRGPARAAGAAAHPAPGLPVLPLLLLEGINLHVASVRALFGERTSRSRPRWAEALLLGIHVAGYLAVLLIALSPLQALVFFIVHQCVFGLSMCATFAPNHKGMPILSEEDELDYLRRQVITSRNIRGAGSPTSPSAG